ncbi:MAG: hypothetical protein SCALA702_02040 [Melioribacteraceae bacterium]|nr:MAG: hypothetical protein SCALA702_02040 [Melioribacteraceae bacterium]
MKYLSLFFISIIILTSCDDNPSTPPVVEEMYQIQGVIIEEGDPVDKLEGIKISIGEIVTESDYDGSFKFTEEFSTTTEIKFSHPDFIEVIKTVPLNDDVSLTIEMKRKTPEYFPNNPGYKWIYSVYDSLTNLSTEVELKIESRYLDTLNRKVSEIGYYLDGTLYFSPKVVSSETNLNIPGMQVLADIPIVVGASIKVDNVISKVIGETNILTEIGEVNTFEVEYLVEGDDEFERIVTWISPHIGIVRQHKYFVSGGTGEFEVRKNEIWKIKAYEIQ